MGDVFGQGDGGGSGGDAGTVGNVEIEGYGQGEFSGMGGVVEVGRVLSVFDDEDEIGNEGGEFDGALDAIAADHGGGDENAFNAVGGEDLGFADFGRARSHGSGLDATPGDFGAFVGFSMGAESAALGLGEGGHFADVGRETVEIDAQGGGRQVVFGEFALDITGSEHAFDFGPRTSKGAGHSGMIAHAIS